MTTHITSHQYKFYTDILQQTRHRWWFHIARQQLVDYITPELSIVVDYQLEHASWEEHHHDSKGYPSEPMMESTIVDDSIEWFISEPTGITLSVKEQQLIEKEIRSDRHINNMLDRC